MQLDHNTNTISITGLYMFTIMALGIPSHQEEILNMNPAQAHCHLQSSFCGLFSFYTLLSNLSLLHAGLASSGKHSHSRLTWEEKKCISYPTSWSTQQIQTGDLKQHPPSSPLCVDLNSAFFAISVVTPCFPPWATWGNWLCPPPLSSFPQWRHCCSVTPSLFPHLHQRGTMQGQTANCVKAVLRYSKEETIWKTISSPSSQAVQRNICNSYKGQEKSFAFAKVS